MIGIERNKNLAGRLHNVAFGAVEVCDGLVRALSLGFLHTRWVVVLTRNQVRATCAKLRKQSEANKQGVKNA